MSGTLPIGKSSSDKVTTKDSSSSGGEGNLYNAESTAFEELWSALKADEGGDTKTEEWKIVTYYKIRQKVKELKERVLYLEESKIDDNDRSKHIEVCSILENYKADIYLLCTKMTDIENIFGEITPYHTKKLKFGGTEFGALNSMIEELYETKKRYPSQDDIAEAVKKFNSTWTPPLDDDHVHRLEIAIQNRLVEDKEARIELHFLDAITAYISRIHDVEKRGAELLKQEIKKEEEPFDAKKEEKDEEEGKQKNVQHAEDNAINGEEGSKTEESDKSADEDEAEEEKAVEAEVPKTVQE